MNLKIKSSWIFAGLIVLFFLTAVFPSSTFIMFAFLIGGVLIAMQAIVILKDDQQPDEE